MQAVIEAVDESRKNTVAEEIGSRWGAAPGSIRLFRASANFVFKFTREGQEYVLRFNHAEERTRQGVEAELAYVHHLAGQGIRVVQPVPSLRGGLVESVQTSLGLFHAVVFEAMRGQQLDLGELTPDQMAQWGNTLGGLHRASQSFAGKGRPSWQDHLAWIGDALPPQEEAARRLLAEMQAQLGRLPVREDDFGLIHFDFELDNLIWTEEGLEIIDFDDSAHYWFAADIAFALRDLFGDSADGVELNQSDFQHFVRGYRAARPLAQEELENIPLFLKLHNLLLFVKLNRALETPTPTDAPLWVKGLRDKLSATRDVYRDRFSGYTR